ncbi:MAG: cyclic-di-AMP receptor [Clostridia bacterium]|nr:cyclic-di-AMP receptor [Clostridia bacterium]
MKLVIAIISNDDCHTVLGEITQAGFSATKLSTSGGFLKAGNVTLLIGVEEERLEGLIDIIRKFSSKRAQFVTPSPSYVAESFVTAPVEVTVGGATVFVLDVDQFYKL